MRACLKRSMNSTSKLVHNSYKLFDVQSVAFFFLFYFIFVDFLKVYDYVLVKVLVESGEIHVVKVFAVWFVIKYYEL